MSTETEHDPGGREAEPQKRLGKKWGLAIMAIIGLVGAFTAITVYGIIGNLRQGAAGPVTAASTAASPTSRGTTAGPSTPGTTGSASRSAASASGSPASASGSPAPHPLDVVSVSAFGPEGAADGDNPAIASRVLNSAKGQAWYTQWYATPEFGDLRPGTGLMLTLAATATVRDVRLVLGSAPGADVQVRVGDVSSANLSTVADAHGVAGTVRLTITAPARGRYVLIWFTRLPPDGLGHYQVSVYSAAVDG